MHPVSSRTVSTGNPWPRSDALVVYMPLKHITQISKMLINAGRSSDEAAAVVSKATMAEQQTVVSTLANIATDAAKRSFVPAGDAHRRRRVRLREGLDWLSALGGSKLNPDPLGNRQLDHSA